MSARSNENVEKTRVIVMQDRRITTRLHAERLGVGRAAARHILERDLRKRKIFSRPAPHSLMAEHREHRVECYRSFIEFVVQDLGVF